MWLGLVASLAGTAASGIGSAMANKKRMADLDAQEAQSNEHFLKQMFEDPTTRADNAAYLSQLDRRMKKVNEVAAAKNKIMGGTQEQAVATQEATANAYSDAISKLGAMTSQKRDALTEMQHKEQLGFQGMRNNFAAEQMKNWGNLAANAAKAGSAALMKGGGSAKSQQNTSNNMPSGSKPGYDMGGGIDWNYVPSLGKR